jgi:hypothetical protein
VDELHVNTPCDQGKAQQTCELLAPAYGWFTEGFDTLDLKEAKALLDACCNNCLLVRRQRSVQAMSRFCPLKPEVDQCRYRLQ